jgi:hypothetical protein
MSSRVTIRTAAAATLVLVPLAGADDATEQALKRHFEGREVVVLIDMPASQAGVDVYPEREYPLDYGKASGRIGDNGISVRRGQRVTVTKVHLKDDLIEFQLGGGGFSQFRHGSSTVPARVTPKSSHERELERRLQRESDPDERRHIKRDLDRVRRQREYMDEQNRAMAEVVNEQRRERDHERALDMGSRFNIRFEKKDVPAEYATPDGVVRALQPYVDFLSLAPRPPRRAEDLVADNGGPGSAGSADAFAVRKGMTREEVEAAYGRPQREDRTREGELTVTVAAYEHGTDRVEVTYVDGVAVRVDPLARR